MKKIILIGMLFAGTLQAVYADVDYDPNATQNDLAAQEMGRQVDRDNEKMMQDMDDRRKAWEETQKELEQEKKDAEMQKQIDDLKGQKQNGIF